MIALALLDVLSTLVKGLPAYQAGGTAPQPLKTMSFSRLPEARKSYLIEVLAHLELGIIKTVPRSTARDQYKFIPLRNLELLLQGHEKIVEILLPLCQKDDEESHTLARMLGLRLAVNYGKRGDQPLPNRVRVKDFLDPHPIPVREFYDRMIAAGGSPVLHRGEIAELIKSTPLSGTPGPECAQKFWTLKEFKFKELSFPLNHIEGKGMIG